MKKITLIIFIFLVISGVLTFLSYRNAKNVALSMLSPIGNELVYGSIHFEPALFFSKPKPERFYALWRTSFCPKDEFCCFPIEIYVSLSGNVKATNPRDLEERIKRTKEHRMKAIKSKQNSSKR